MKLLNIVCRLSSLPYLRLSSVIPPRRDQPLLSSMLVHPPYLWCSISRHIKSPQRTSLSQLLGTVLPVFVVVVRFHHLVAVGILVLPARSAQVKWLVGRSLPFRNCWRKELLPLWQEDPGVNVVRGGRRGRLGGRWIGWRLAHGGLRGRWLLLGHW